MNLQSNDFELFGVPQRFAQDMGELETRWKALQREAHPDRFTAQGHAAQRLAMQWSVRINEAWQRLRDPLRRAAYLCELAGVPTHSHVNAVMPPDFLVRQMEWHERIAEANSAAELEALAGDLAVERTTALQRVAELLDGERDAAAAAQQVRMLMFIGRLAQGVDDKRDATSDAVDASSRGQ